MLSLSTVYNTVKVLKAIGEIQELTISDDRVYLEPNLQPHHHFLCQECGRIYDIWPQDELLLPRVNGHEVRQVQVYYYGICAACQKKSSTAS
jgi:Fe2+ or Zn2+ uptake regulation protein